MADLRGAARLAAEATAGLTDLVEAMHERIARLPGVPAPAVAGRTRGITGLVYKSVRGVTRLVGGSVDALFGLLTPALSPDGPVPLPGPEREALLAALNGVFGDHLAATNNPLATPMALRRSGLPLVPARAALQAAVPEAGPRVVVLVHGLCMNDRQWLRDGHDHGAALARDHGYTAVYLHYNTGLPIADNARAFSAMLEQLLQAWPVPLERLAIVGHSMGGLVAHSAVHEAVRAGRRWPKRLDDLVFIGSPLLGAPLERAGHWVDGLLGATPYSAPLARLTSQRSAGITDLRHPPLLGLPAGIRCSTIAGTLGAGNDALQGRVLGDGLVPLASALGRHRTVARRLAFDTDRQCVVPDTHHLALLSSAAVYAQLERWLR